MKEVIPKGYIDKKATFHASIETDRCSGQVMTNRKEWMMKRVISSKKVLNELCNQFNENSEAYGYAMVIGDAETADKLQMSMNTICELLRNLGFHDGTEYVTYRDKKEIMDTPFLYYKKVVRE